MKKTTMVVVMMVMLIAVMVIIQPTHAESKEKCAYFGDVEEVTPNPVAEGNLIRYTNTVVFDLSRLDIRSSDSISLHFKASNKNIVKSTIDILYLDSEKYKPGNPSSMWENKTGILQMSFDTKIKGEDVYSENIKPWIFNYFEKDKYVAIRIVTYYKKKHQPRDGISHIQKYPPELVVE